MSEILKTAQQKPQEVASSIVLGSIESLSGAMPADRQKLIYADHGDMIEERLDLAWRSGEIADTSLIARPAGELGRAAVAAPIYLERHGARLLGRHRHEAPGQENARSEKSGR